MIAWILSLMIALQPQAPWRDSYEETARAIATVVEEEPPFFRGVDAKHRTAALLVSLAWAESRFDPKAVGDHGRSVGLYQIFHANLPTKEGFGKADILGNALAATRVAHRMIRESMNVCAQSKVEERLAWYASGDSTCHFGAAASKFRYGTAMRVFREHPPTPSAMRTALAP
ncbi:MAG: transglycosylase SLT domain-containing protein [Polyangiaceae bacterium]